VTANELTGLLPLALAVFVVFRFAVRELRERVVKSPGIWIRPAIMAVLLAFLIVMTFSTDGRDDAVTFVSLATGAVLGAIVGFAILRNTTFAPADQPRAVRAQGSRVTLAIWIAALAVRLLARYLAPGGADPRAQLPLNCGTVALVAVAFVVIAVGFQREIGHHAGASRTFPST